MLIFKLSCLEKVLLPKFGGLTLNISEPLFFDDVRESSFNMTRGGGGGERGWRYWNSKLEIFVAPLANGSIF